MVKSKECGSTPCSPWKVHTPQPAVQQLRMGTSGGFKPLPSLTQLCFLELRRVSTCASKASMYIPALATACALLGCDAQQVRAVMLEIMLAGEYIAVEKVEAVYKKNALVEQVRPCMRSASALSRCPGLALCTT